MRNMRTMSSLVTRFRNSSGKSRETQRNKLAGGGQTTRQSFMDFMNHNAPAIGAISTIFIGLYFIMSLTINPIIRDLEKLDKQNSAFKLEIKTELDKVELQTNNNKVEIMRDLDKIDRKIDNLYFTLLTNGRSNADFKKDNKAPG